MSILRLATVTVCALLLSAATLRAQDPPETAGRGRGEQPPVLSPAEVIAMLDAYALVQAENALGLGEGQYGEFVARLKRLQETRRRHQVARNRMIQELRRLTAPGEPPAGEAALRERLDALKRHDQRTAGDLARAYAALDEVLDVRQQARFRVFEEMLERRKIDLLMRARRGAGGRQGQ